MDTLFKPFEWFARWLAFSLFGLEESGRLGEAVAFFAYDVPKVLLLLAAIVFVVAVVRSFFPPDRTRRRLAGTHLYVGNVLAGGLGVLTPF